MNASSAEKRCSNCEFWDELSLDDMTGDLKGEGSCRKCAPKTMLVQLCEDTKDWQFPLTHNACWPVTDKDDWCGEFEHKGKNINGNINSQSVRVLHLSSRARGICRWENITTVGQLREMSDSEFLSFPRAGRITLIEIRKAIKRVCAKTEQK